MTLRHLSEECPSRRSLGIEGMAGRQIAEQGSELIRGSGLIAADLPRDRPIEPSFVELWSDFERLIERGDRIFRIASLHGDGADAV